ncbi:MAG: hypothetical protein KC431_22845, partial [Myxococcales bacterium]|nr:hypothetical protein [Myxococcales bacterium]
EAQPLLRRAADIALADAGSPEPALGTALLGLALTALDEGRLDDAEELVSLARRIYGRGLPQNHPGHGNAAMVAATVAYERGELIEARRGYRDAVAAFVAAGAEASADPTLALLEANAALCDLVLGDHGAARRGFEASLAGPEGIHAVIAHLGLAEIELAMPAPERDADAIQAHLRALDALDDGLDDGDRLERELLRALAALRLPRWVGAGSAPRLSAGLSAALDDPEHGDHQRLQQVLTIVGLEAREREALGLPP